MNSNHVKMNEGATDKNILCKMMSDDNANEIFEKFICNLESGRIQDEKNNSLLGYIDEYVIHDGNGSFHKTLKNGTKVYRARIITPKNDFDKIDCVQGKRNGTKMQWLWNGHGFTESESREAPLGTNSAGRNNIEGVSYFYSANSQETACVEVKPLPKQIISVATFEVKTTLHMIDFTSTTKSKLKHPLTYYTDPNYVNLETLFLDIFSCYSNPVIDIKKYKATQFLSDYLRKTGIDGICYQSYFDNKGINYVIFNSFHENLEFIESEIILAHGIKARFINCNSKKNNYVESENYVKSKKYNPNEEIEDLKIAIENWKNGYK